jgi:hypothetical protein
MNEQLYLTDIEISSFIRTARKARRQILRLMDVCKPAERRQLRELLKPITPASIACAVLCDRLIRELL